MKVAETLVVRSTLLSLEVMSSSFFNILIYLASVWETGRVLNGLKPKSTMSVALWDSVQIAMK